MATDILNAQEQEELFRLGEDIQAGLSCDANGTGIPCRTDRLDAVENMKRYLEIHNYTVKSGKQFQPDTDKERAVKESIANGTFEGPDSIEDVIDNMKEKEL